MMNPVGVQFTLGIPRKPSVAILPLLSQLFALQCLYSMLPD